MVAPVDMANTATSAQRSNDLKFTPCSCDIVRNLTNLNSIFRYVLSQINVTVLYN